MICVRTSTLIVSIQTHKLNIYIMMRLLETTSGIYNMEFTRHLEAYPIVSNITINCPKDPLQVSIKTQRIFTNKSP